MSSHQTKTILSRLCRGQAPLDVSRIWTRAHLSEEEKPKLFLTTLLLPTAVRTEQGASPQWSTVVLQGWSLTKSTRFSWPAPSTALPPRPQGSWCGQQTQHTLWPESPNCSLGRRGFLCPAPQASLIIPLHLPFQQDFLRGQGYCHQALLTSGD